MIKSIDLHNELTVNSSDSQNSPSPVVQPNSHPESEPQPVTNNSMDEYYHLKKSIFFVTLMIAGVVCLGIGFLSTWSNALSYLIGALGGMLYFRMLAKNVEKLSPENPSSNLGRFAVLAGLVIVGAKWELLNVFPLILGFLTYKAAILFYVLPSTLMQVQKSE